MARESQSTKELQQIVETLRNQLAEEKEKNIDLECSFNDSQNNIEQFQRKLMMHQKKDTLLKQNNQHLSTEIQKLKHNQESEADTQNSVQQALIKDLELKLKQIQSQNELLKQDN